jgi:hypothetical protein
MLTRFDWQAETRSHPCGVANVATHVPANGSDTRAGDRKPSGPGCADSAPYPRIVYARRRLTIHFTIHNASAANILTQNNVEIDEERHLKNKNT